MEKDNPELFKQFAGDIKKLDSTYQVLRNTLPANPNKEQLLQAMIGNLQMQISLLNQQLQIIQQVMKRLLRFSPFRMMLNIIIYLKVLTQLMIKN